MSDSNENPSANSYKPNKLTSGAVEIKAFKPRALTGEVANDYEQVKKQFGTLANTDVNANSHFNLHPAAKRLLGVEQEERSHVEGMVRAEVDERLARLSEEAYAKGFEQGRVEGQGSAEKEYLERVQPMQDQFSTLIAQFDEIKKDLYVANEAFLIQLVFQVSKQILLKELTTDREYVKRLLGHVVEKMGAKDNIRIKISRQDFENLEQIKDHLKALIPDLKNIQIEASDELLLGGCKVETDLSRVNASVETQLSSVEKALGES